MRTLGLLERSASLSAATIFDTEADGVIVEQVGRGLIDERRQSAVLGSFNLSLPYLEGIPAERLLELREGVPEAFGEFRARMVDIIGAAAKEDPTHAAEAARLVVERDVVPTLPKLDSEMHAAAVKAKVLGVGLPAVAATGALLGSILGVSLTELLPLLVTGAAARLQVESEYQERIAKATQHPFYFLWLARQ